MVEARGKDFARMFRQASTWKRRDMQGWKNFKGGTAWAMLYGGLPAKIHVQLHGLLDEWPYHIVYCEVVSMDARLTLVHGKNRRSEWWSLARLGSAGKPVWSKRGVRGKVQKIFRSPRRAA